MEIVVVSFDPVKREYIRVAATSMRKKEMLTIYGVQDGILLGWV